MLKFAVIEGENVINTIVAESKEIAEEITEKICIEFTTERAEIDGTYADGVFIPRKPYASWVLDSDNEWEAPVARPEEGDYIWDEPTTSWISA